MMRDRFATYRRLAWIMIALVCLVDTAQVLAWVPNASALTIEPLAPITIGAPAILRVRLNDATGQAPLARRIVRIFVDGVAERPYRTDEFGAATIATLPIATSGTHRIEVVFGGTPKLPGARAAIDLVVKPARLTIQTVPPLPGAQFALAGQVVSADQQGTAHITVDRAATYRLTALPPPDSDDLRREWSRWSDAVFVPERDISIPKITWLQAGFNSYSHVRPQFTDRDGQAVEPGRITSLTVRNNLRRSYTFVPETAQWLPQSGIAYEQGRLRSMPITYTVESAIVDGSNVAQSDAGRVIAAGQPWRIALQLYAISFTAIDSLMQQPIGTGIEVEYPLGRLEYHSFGADHMVQLRGLAFGLYRARVVGSSGIAPIVLVRVPDQQIARLYTVSEVDLALWSLLLLELMLLFRVLWRAQRLLTRPRYGTRPHTHRRRWPASSHRKHDHA
jgi:hypothetical protein